MRRAGPVVLLAVATVLPARVAAAAQRPLWELGIGAGVLSYPDYPGAAQRQNHLLPVPYVIYRGPILHAGRDGVQARVFETSRWSGRLSLGASPPVNSSSDGARHGMADLRPTVEFGPSLQLRLWRGARARVDLRLPLRSAFTVERNPHNVGWLATPVLNLDMRETGALRGWKLGLQGGPMFVDRRYAQHDYGVAAADATASRPAYAASGGYAGSALTTALSRRFAHYWVGAFVRCDLLGGASFADSPLLQRHTAWSFGVGFAWVFDHSTRTVDSGADD